MAASPRPFSCFALTEYPHCVLGSWGHCKNCIDMSSCNKDFVLLVGCCPQVAIYSGKRFTWSTFENGVNGDMSCVTMRAAYSKASMRIDQLVVYHHLLWKTCIFRWWMFVNMVLNARHDFEACWYSSPCHLTETYIMHLHLNPRRNAPGSISSSADNSTHRHADGLGPFNAPNSCK